MLEKNARVLLLLALAAGWIIMAGGCRPALESLAVRLTPSATFVLPTETLAVTETPTEKPVSCAFVWSNRSLPEVSIGVNQAFRRIGLVEVEVEASAYGEDCVDTETNQVVRFSAMQTDFYFIVAVEKVDDLRFLGEWIERIAGVMEDFQPGQVPGPTPGYFSITFSNGSETTNLWIPRARIDNLLEEGIRGEELYEALQTR